MTTTSRIRLTTLKGVPPLAQGLVRDLRVRWALEETDLPYDTHLLAPGEHKAPDYIAMQPFGQVPIIEDGELTLFESGAIVLHIADRSEMLLPEDPDQRARARAADFKHIRQGSTS